ncbi:MAG TPA: hypothetical protein VM282_21580, partial [Acidimicrobiales bacterium]|nr:hypothetical protein [Acidimicrobiales bacterium]
MAKIMQTERADVRGAAVANELLGHPVRTPRFSPVVIGAKHKRLGFGLGASVSVITQQRHGLGIESDTIAVSVLR